VLVGYGRKPLLREVEEGGEGGGKAVEGDLKELDLLRRDVGR
jgi:hypothetical protein